MPTLNNENEAYDILDVLSNLTYLNIICWYVRCRLRRVGDKKKLYLTNYLYIIS